MYHLRMSPKHVKVATHALQVWDATQHGNLHEALVCLPWNRHMKDKELAEHYSSVEGFIAPFLSEEVGRISGVHSLISNLSGDILLSEDDTYTLKDALELFFRLKMGQITYLVDYAPIDVTIVKYPSILTDTIIRYFRDEECLEDGMDGWHKHLGINNVDEMGRLASDIHQVLRHRLAWDVAYDTGVLSMGEDRKWPSMMGVCYDPPIAHSNEPLMTIERTL